MSHQAILNLMLRWRLAIDVYSQYKQYYFCFITGLYIWLHINISPTNDGSPPVVIGGPVFLQESESPSTFRIILCQ